MDEILSFIQIHITEPVYLKDPFTSSLGTRILKEAIALIDGLGLEQFTFKKMAQALETAESSIYRYFENKHKLLLYLTSWYWRWLEYQVVFATQNLAVGEGKLLAALGILAVKRRAGEHPTIDLAALQRIVISESPKAYLTKSVDVENRDGMFAGYKQLCMRFKKIILEINPDYPYATALSNTLVEGVFHHLYMQEHFPTLTMEWKNPEELVSYFCGLAMNNLKT